MSTNPNITYRDCTAEGSEICRDLCNQLMQHQASMSANELYRDILGNMTYDSRLKRSFDGAEEKLLLVAFDGDKPIGYLYVAGEMVTEGGKNFLPPWASRMPEGKLNGFYPEWLEVPVKVGALNNLFVLPEYRGLGIGDELTKRGMEWLRAVPDAKYLFVDISDGNNVIPFYERFGFQYSHDVAGGIIKAYYQSL